MLLLRLLRPVLPPHRPVPRSFLMTRHPGKQCCSRYEQSDGSQISTKPSQRQPAEEKASGSEQSALVNSQATSDICTDPTCQLASNQTSLAGDFPPLSTLRQTEQSAAKKSTRHSPITHGASAHTHKSQASFKQRPEQRHRCCKQHQQH